MSESVATLPRQDPPEAPAAAPSRLQTRIEDALISLSLASFCLIHAWHNPLSQNAHGYFNDQPITRVTLLAILAAIFSLASLSYLVMRLRRRTRNRWVTRAIHLLFFVALLIALDGVRIALLHITDFQLAAFLRRPWARVAGAGLLVLVCWRHRLAAKVAAIVVGLFSPLAIVNVCEIVLLLLGIMKMDQQDIVTPVLPPPLPVHREQPRVLWLIFDEMDYRLAFEQRPPGVDLPQFDRVRNEAICSIKAYPPGDSTLLSMPALISGRRIVAAQPISPSELKVTLAGSGEVTLWNKLPSVFTAARQAGVNTAIVGWYHPYDRVLGDGLNYCSWYPGFQEQPTRAPEFGTVMARELRSMVWEVHMRELFKEICLGNLSTSLSVATNATYGLTLLHMPTPHTPGVYDPGSGQITIWRSLRLLSKTQDYLDNLRLADRTMGNLRAGLERAGLWDSTWVIISADHSWRASRAYDGRRDQRVPYLIKTPGPGKPVTFSPEINTVLTHDLILAILGGELHGQQDTMNWLDLHSSVEPHAAEDTP